MKEREFTEYDLLDTLRESLLPQYLRYPIIQQMYDFEDLVQDCALSFYEPMKSTGIQRLKYYTTGYSWKHTRNIVKLCTCQCIPNYLRSNFCKYFPTSLNQQAYKDEGDSKCELIDFIQDPDEDILLKAEVKEIISLLNKEQLDVANDLIAGFTKTALRNKYKRFDYILEEIRDRIEYYYRTTQDKVPDVIERRKVY